VRKAKGYYLHFLSEFPKLLLLSNPKIDYIIINYKLVVLYTYYISDIYSLGGDPKK
jgi:hypothetical protein